MQASTPLVVRTKLSMPVRRPETIERNRVIDTLQAAAERPLMIVSAPAGFGKTTAVAEWVDATCRVPAWLSLDDNDNDPQRLWAHVLAALDQPLRGAMKAAIHSLHGGSNLHETVVPLTVDALAAHDDVDLVLVLDDYHHVTEPACHGLILTFLDALPRFVRVVVASRTVPPLRLGRSRAARSVAEIGATELCFSRPETELLLNGALELGLTTAELALIEERVQGWAAGLALVATALDGERDLNELLDAGADSDASLSTYLVEEVLEVARPELRDFLCRTSILGRLNASLCRALLGDPHAAELLDEVRRMNLFVTRLDGDGAWLRYHHLFAETLARTLERRDPDLVRELHLRAMTWFEGAGMPTEAIEHATAADDGRRAADLLSRYWPTLVAARCYVTLRRILDRLPAERGEFGPFCDALDVLCTLYEGVDQRITHERAEALANAHGDAPGVSLLLDSIRISPFYGDVARALALGWDAWRRYADQPAVRLQLAGPFGLVLWFAEDYESVHAALEPRLGLEQPPFSKIWILGVLALTAVDEGEHELAERYAREAMALVEAIGAQTATEFTGMSWLMGEVLRVRGKLEEADVHLRRGLEAEARRPGSIGYALALIFDAQLDLARGDRRRARVTARQARRIIDRYRDVGTLERRLARVEAVLAGSLDNPLLGRDPTPAELRVLALLDSGRTLEQIAAELHVSHNTVKSHTRRLYRRLGERTRADALRAARERGLLPDP